MSRRTIIYGGTILALIVAWGYVVWMPHARKTRAAEALAEDTRRQLAEVQQFTLNLPDFMETQERLEAERTDLNSRLYAAADIMALLDELRDQADLHQLRVIEITPPIEELLRINDALTKSTDPQYLNVDILISGDFVSLGKFVQQIEHKEYTRGINRCIIVGVRDGSEPLQMQLGFRAMLGAGGGV